MIEKNKILESWIMVEHLSEGDIGLNDKAILTLNDLQETQTYFFKNGKPRKVEFSLKLSKTKSAGALISGVLGAVAGSLF